eukprot:910624-Pyramimonas_sp.AAC.1
MRLGRQIDVETCACACWRMRGSIDRATLANVDPAHALGAVYVAVAQSRAFRGSTYAVSATWSKIRSAIYAARAMRRKPRGASYAKRAYTRRKLCGVSCAVQ